MRVIQTRFHGPGNVRGARISARDEAGNTAVIPYPYELSIEGAHRKAARQLCDKMDWHGTLLGDAFKKGYIFVLLENDPLREAVIKLLKYLTNPERKLHVNPYSIPELRNVIVALGGDGYNIPEE